MTPRIENAINIFLDAINEGTLAKGDCTACAVGNLVAAGAGAKIKQLGLKPRLTNGKIYDNTDWSIGFCTYSYGQSTCREEFGNPNFLDNISKTQFSIKELMHIEYAFEKNTKIDVTDYPTTSKSKIRKDQINGLKAVVEVMLSFDEQKDDVNEVFVNKAELIPIK